MARQVVDFDKILDEQGFTLKFKGQEFVISDIPDELFEKIEKELQTDESDTDKVRDLMAEVIGCDKKLLEDLGMVGLMRLQQVIMENLFPVDLQKVQSED